GSVACDKGRGSSAARGSVFERRRFVEQIVDRQLEIDVPQIFGGGLRSGLIAKGNVERIQARRAVREGRKGSKIGRAGIARPRAESDSPITLRRRLVYYEAVREVVDEAGNAEPFAQAFAAGPTQTAAPF